MSFGIDGGVGFVTEPFSEQWDIVEMASYGPVRWYVLKPA